MRTRKRPDELSLRSGASPLSRRRERTSISVSPALGTVTRISPPRMTRAPRYACGSPRIWATLSERFTDRVSASGKGEAAQPVTRSAAAPKGSERKLPFWRTRRGAKSCFASFDTPEMLAGSLTVRASFVQNERTALREGDGRYAAQWGYAFPAEGIDPRGRVVLVVRDA